jgi:hypothetical protein
MNRILVIRSMALLCVVGFATSHSLGVGVQVQFDNSAANGDFTEALNWADDTAPSTGNNKIYQIQNGLTADLTGTTASVHGVTTGDASVGRFIIDNATLNVISETDVHPHPSGFPTGFHVGGHFSNHTGNGTVDIINGGVVNVIRDPTTTNTAHGRDVGFVGERADGTVNIGAGSLLDAPEIIWRIGQFGGVFGVDFYDADAIVNIEGTFNADIIFASPNGGDSEFNLSGNGRLFTTRAFQAKAFDHFADANAVIRMTGSNASWDSDDIIIDRGGAGAQPRPHVIFTSDAGGVSPMTSRDALLFNDAEVTVDLTANGPLARFERMLLFDAAPGQLANGHTFGQLNVLGVPNPGNYKLIYKDFFGGDIFLTNVPEPSAGALVVLGLLGVAARWRRRI